MRTHERRCSDRLAAAAQKDASHLRQEDEMAEPRDNHGQIYRSAVEHRDEIEKTFLEQDAEKLMVPVGFKNAKRTYGNRLRVAALGALEQAPSEFRVIHDGTHGVSVNNFYKGQGPRGPLAGDLLSSSTTLMNSCLG